MEIVLFNDPYGFFVYLSSWFHEELVNIFTMVGVYSPLSLRKKIVS